jgi:EmrB/QacA subfamily drug resistance transporter
VTDLHDETESVSLGGGGSEEVVVIPWAAMLRNRVAGRVAQSDAMRWWVLWTVLAGLLSVNFTFTIFAVALPRIATGLHSDVTTLTWVITGPLLSFGVAAPALGKLGDLWGHRRLYLLGMSGAVVFAALTAMAPSAGTLILVRTLSGLEGAATGAASMALIFSVFDRDDRVKAMGFWSLVGAGGPVIGVVVGGPVIQAIGWRWIFVAQVPMTIAALVLAVVVLPETTRSKSGGFDWPGTVALTIGITGVLFGLNRGPSWGWSSPGVIIAFACGPVFGYLFVMAERRAHDPLLPLAYLRRRNFAFPILAQVFANFSYMGGFILAPLLLEQVFGFSESRVGVMVIARPLTFSIAAPLAGYLTVKIGERTAAIIGTAAVSISMLVFASVTRSSGNALVLLALGMSGVGLGISSPAIAASIANAVDHDDLGIASAAQQLMTQVGVVAGIQLLETVQAARRHSAGLIGSFHQAYILGAGVAALGVVASLFLRRDPRLDPVP